MGLVHGLRALTARLRRRRRRRRGASPHVWSIGIYEGPSPIDLGPPGDVANPVLTRADVSDVPAKFVADPFMLVDAGSWYMFFEVLNGARNRGEVGLATSADGRRWRYEGIVISEPFHMSYPYVFEWQGARWMVPETYQAGAVRLYEATSFPTRWRCVAELLRGPFFADSSLLHWDGRWWLFTETSAEFRSDTLRLYSAPDLAGEWREHPASPILEGNRHLARPAGRVVVDGTRIIRYAQDCAPMYGMAVRAFEVAELTPTCYRERLVREAPVLQAGHESWNRGGMHHVDPHPAPGGRWVASVDGWFPKGADAR